jgi:hypothetical protein
MPPVDNLHRHRPIHSLQSLPTAVLYTIVENNRSGLYRRQEDNHEFCKLTPCSPVREIRILLCLTSQDPSQGGIAAVNRTVVWALHYRFGYFGQRPHARLAEVAPEFAA